MSAKKKEGRDPNSIKADLTEAEINKQFKKLTRKKNMHPNSLKNLELTHNNIDIIVLPKDWKTNILGIYKTGGFDVNVKLWIRLKVETFTNAVWQKWLGDYDEFRKVIEYGHDLSYAYWLNLAKKNIDVRNFNNATWRILMVNMFRWKEATQDIVTTVKEEKYDEMSEADLVKNLDKEIGLLRETNLSNR